MRTSVIDTTRKIKLALIKQNVPKIEDFYQTMYYGSSATQQEKFADAASTIGLVDTGHSEVVIRVESGSEFYDIWIRPCGENKAAIIGQLVHAVKNKKVTDKTAANGFRYETNKDTVIWELEPLNTLVPAMVHVRLNTLFSMIGVTLQRGTPKDLWHAGEEPVVVPFSVSESRYSFHAHKMDVVAIMPIVIAIVMFHPKIIPMIRQSQLMPSVSAWATQRLGVPAPYCQDGYRGLHATSNQITRLMAHVAKDFCQTNRQAALLSDILRMSPPVDLSPSTETVTNALAVDSTGIVRPLAAIPGVDIK